MLKRWHIYNKLPIHSTERITSITADLDVFSKIKTNINTMTFHGESNAGKSIVMNSAFKVFPHVYQLYKGVANNFMFQDAIGTQAILWEEASFNSMQQESYKLLTEGSEISTAVKGTKNDILNRTPVGITCNQLPWCTMTHVEDENAFKNRSYTFNTATADCSRSYENKGSVDPRVWLCLDTDHWETVLTTAQLTTRENIIRELYGNILEDPRPFNTKPST